MVSKDYVALLPLSLLPFFLIFHSLLPALFSLPAAGEPGCFSGTGARDRHGVVGFRKGGREGGRQAGRG